MEYTVDAAKEEFTRAKDRMAKALATTPDDKVNWSPSPTARTPVEQVAHAANATKGIQGMLAGTPMEMPGSIAEMDAGFRQSEKGCTSRAQAHEMLEQTSGDFIAFLDGLTPEQVASTAHTPFGDFPMAYAITFPADHMRGHAAQLEYIQTIYGDQDWHM